MKTYKYTIILLSILTLIILEGCKKEFLDRSPTDELTAAAFLQNDDELYAYTAPLYSYSWYNYNAKCGYALGDARGGNLKSNNRDNYYKFTVQPSYWEVEDAWSSLYSLIGNCNMFIYNLKTYAGPNVTEEAVNHCIGEARFMRSIAYVVLALLWENVPIIYDNVNQISDTNVVPNTLESVWQFAIRDMRFAANNLAPIQIDDGRVTNWVAKAYLGKWYIFHSGLNSTNGKRNVAELDSAKKYLGDVCINSPYKLMDNYYDLFLTENDNNSESMFALQFISTNDYGYGNEIQAQCAFEPLITDAGSGWGGGLGPSSDMINYYLNVEPTDTLRRYATFMFNGDYYPDLRTDLGGYYFTDTAKNMWAAIKKYVIGSTADNPEPQYFLNASNNAYMMRLAEVYLLYAESILGDQDSTTNPEALYYFNSVRARAGLDSVKSIRFGLDTITNNGTQGRIFWEKRVELCMEGDTWYDMVRISYFKNDDLLKFIATQDKGDQYKLYSDPGDTTYTFIPKPEYYSPNQNTFYLPIPEIESAISHNLRKTPIPFDFSVLEENE